MRETEFWERMRTHLGSAYSQVWASQQNLGQLGGRTVYEAMDAGIDCKTIWRAVWEALELPPGER
ncbi:MAG: DUF3046 domain-containing protein [Microlunatus sp.]|nr:DUF3046 domain-containing protein [Microlunatus sp.]